ncbi:Rep [uncultured virus]|uniref:Rep n=1 Tax=uncultured virus TaxID=340016 RepID=A0A2K9LRZ3_9VIRU|nr:Rep [uncultured virus]
MKNFRLNSKNLFLTYPRCNIARETILVHLQDKFKENLEEYLIVQEMHKDGEIHIHAYLGLKQKINYKDPKCLDILDHHGEYESMKNKEKTIEYLLKEDKQPLQSQDWQQWLMQSKSHQKRQNNMDKLNYILDNGLQKAVLTGNIPLVQLPTYQKALDIYKTLDEKDDREDIPEMLDTPWNFKLKYDIGIKKCHYWIYSTKSNYGKTTFAQQLIKKYKSETWNSEEKYQPHIKRSTQMIIIDEFSQRNCLTISVLNMLMDGTIYLTAKGINAWKLNQKPIVIILSNFSPLDIYTKTPNLPNLLSRIEIINLEDNHKGF